MIPRINTEYVQVNVVELLGIDVTDFLDYEYCEHAEENRPKPLTVRELIKENAIALLGGGIPDGAEINVDFDSETASYQVTVAWIEWDDNSN